MAILLSVCTEPLSHSAFEGPDPKSLYDGKVELDDSVVGEDGVELLEWDERRSVFAGWRPSGRPSIEPTSQYIRRAVGRRPLRGNVGGRLILNRNLKCQPTYEQTIEHSPLSSGLKPGWALTNTTDLGLLPETNGRSLILLSFYICPPPLYPD